METHQFAVWILAVPLLAAQAPPEPGQRPPRPPSIHTSGAATVSARPDQVRMAIAVVTEAPTAQAAAAQNAQQLETVLNALRRVLGGAGDLRTIGYNLTPVYNYRQGAPPTITGYRATNTVQVTTGELSRAGALLDAATHSGANSVTSLQFTLQNDQPARAQALRQAALQARSSADALASALGLRIVRVLSVQEGAPRVIRPVREMAMPMAAAAAPPTPVEPGTVDIRAEVTLIVEVQ